MLLIAISLQEESYNYVDASLSSSDSPDYIQVFEEDVTMLIRPVYTSVAYGFTVLGGYLIILAALAWLERKPKSRSRRATAISDDLCSDFYPPSNVLQDTIRVSFSFGILYDSSDYASVRADFLTPPHPLFLLSRLTMVSASIGHEVTADNLLGRGTPSAPIYKLVANGTFAATIFLVLFSVTLLDLVSEPAPLARSLYTDSHSVHRVPSVPV